MEADAADADWVMRARLRSAARTAPPPSLLDLMARLKSAADLTLLERVGVTAGEVKALSAAHDDDRLAEEEEAQAERRRTSSSVRAAISSVIAARSGGDAASAADIESELLTEVENNNVKAVRDILKREETRYSRTKDDRLLRAAIRRKKLPMIQLLLDKGTAGSSNLDGDDREHDAIVAAVRTKNVDVVRKVVNGLRAEGKDLDAALLEAARVGSLKIVEYLYIDADANLVFGGGEVLAAARDLKHADVIEFLEEQAEVTDPDYQPFVFLDKNDLMQLMGSMEEDEEPAIPDDVVVTMNTARGPVTTDAVLAAGSALGLVLHGTTADGAEFAVKTVGMSNVLAVRLFIAEIVKLTYLCHAADQTEKFACLVGVDVVPLGADASGVSLAYASELGVPLSDYMERFTLPRDRERELNATMLHATDNVAFLHSLGAVHRDIKPDNIVVVLDVNERVTGTRLIDFDQVCLTTVDEKTLKAAFATVVDTMARRLVQMIGRYNAEGDARLMPLLATAEAITTSIDTTSIVDELYCESARQQEATIEKLSSGYIFHPPSSIVSTFLNVRRERNDTTSPFEFGVFRDTYALGISYVHLYFGGGMDAYEALADEENVRNIVSRAFPLTKHQVPSVMSNLVAAISALVVTPPPTDPRRLLSRDTLLTMLGLRERGALASLAEVRAELNALAST